MLSNKGFIGGGSGYWWHAHIKYYLPRTPPRHTHIYIHGGNSLWCFCMKVNEWRVLFMLSVKMNERERLILQQFPMQAKVIATPCLNRRPYIENQFSLSLSTLPIRRRQFTFGRPNCIYTSRRVKSAIVKKAK